MGGLEVRPARSDELDAVRALLAASLEEHVAAFPPELGAAYAEETVDLESRSATSDLVVAISDDEIVGTVTFVPDAADDAHPWPAAGSVLRLLAVRPDARGIGVGRALTEDAIERARHLGSGFLGLHTAPFMSTAQRLYERLGFERAPEQDFDPFRHYVRSPSAEPTHAEVLAASGLAYVLHLADVAEAIITTVALPYDPTIASVARRAVATAVEQAIEDVDDLVLSASELATNALLHGAPPVELEVSIRGGTVRVAVADAAPGVVTPRDIGQAATASGRGLTVVASVATRWGVRPTAEGKAVWFEVDRP